MNVLLQGTWMLHDHNWKWQVLDGYVTAIDYTQGRAHAASHEMEAARKAMAPSA